MANLPATRPVCSAGHGYMTYRPGWTREQRWCGTWYDCTTCRTSALLPSPELTAHLATMNRTPR